MIVAARLFPTAVMSKDLRLRMRGWRWAGVVTLYVAILGLVAIAFLAQRYNLTADSTSGSGTRLLQCLAIFQLFLIVFVTPASLAGAISGERQQGTWDLLVTSRLRAAEIVLGKLLAGLAFNVVLIAASLPIFCLTFLFGGLALPDLIPAFVVLLVTALLLSATSLLVSALTARLTVSYMISMVVALALVIGLSVLALDLQEPTNPGVLSLGAILFQSSGTPTSLTPLAHLDPLTALLSALPAEGGGSVLGQIGTVDRAFGLPWTLPLWGAYAFLSVLLSLVLSLATTRLAVYPGRPRLLALTRRSGRDMSRGQPDGGQS